MNRPEQFPRRLQPNPLHAEQAPPGVVWEPTPDMVEQTNLQRLVRSEGLSGFDELWRKAIDDRNWFWDAVVRDLRLSWMRPYQRAFEPTSDPKWPDWFVGGLLNVAENCLGRHVRAGYGETAALISERENGQLKRTTYRELDSLSNRLANGLRRLGAERGDRIGLFLPMTEEAAVAVLACAKIGAVFCPAFSGHGTAAVVARFGDCGVRLIITAQGFQRRGRQIDLLSVARSAAAELPGHPSLVVVCHGACANTVALREREVEFESLVDQEGESFTAEPMGADDILMILYTSGTTGKPKGTVHSHAGFLVKAAQDMSHAFDVRQGDVIFWVTDLGWIMGTWLILSGLCLGATVAMYDGAADFPGPDRLWQFIDRHAVSMFGVTPSLVRSLMAEGHSAAGGYSLATLRILGSTGEPWDGESWDWFFRSVGRRKCPVINYSGGTEVGGGILGCFPVFSQKPCAFNGPFPGMDADVFDGAGGSLRGEVGELVVKGPWPGQTRGFWRDPERYQSTYWSRWSGVWEHGDWAMIGGDGFWYIHGRSDDTLNVAGKRVGPGEIESTIERFGGVKSAAVIAYPDPLKGEVPIAFIILERPGVDHDRLEAEIIEYVSANMGAPLRPAAVRVVTDLPRTRNGKLARRAIRDAFLGVRTAVDRDALENGSAIDAIAALGPSDAGA